MPPRATFTDLLIHVKLLTAEKLAEAQKLVKAQNIPLYEAVIAVGVPAADVYKALSKENGIPYVDLNEFSPSPEAVECVPESIAREHTIFPHSVNEDAVTVVVHDPFNLDLLDNLRFILNRRVNIVIAPKDSIIAAINRTYSFDSGTGDTMFEEVAAQSEDMKGLTGGEGEVIDETSAPIIRLVQLMITEAVQMRASDIHIEPFEDRVRVRYRVDGVLEERDSIPKRLQNAVISRLKILSKIDIAERRRAQDGRIKVTMPKKELDLRVSVLPTNHGQSIVMRLLDKDNIKIGLKQLGMADDDFRTFNGLVRRPNGIILVTGPTGSGKTTTLYAALNDLNRPDKKIITAEDPVEYYLQGINQVEVKHSIGLDFARIIRAMLRQAPNVILVGEMRDSETAEMGIQASLTGHLVLSTLHTNDAPSAVTRMVDMGVPAYLVASSVIAVLAQRLVRVVCPKCKQPQRPSDAQLEAAGIPFETAQKATFMKGKGCGNCSKSGYRGRLGIYELMMMSSRVRELAFQGASSQDIRKVAVSQGMRTLYRDGIEKAMRGITTLDEVMRITKRTEDD
jgi:type IV pilus assembly protein PilB